ncbi:integrin alpha-7-like [Mercenaria mercenaria]|uniref:integrin alpha-7-like n=1 Tax=Mercenaria mercenaria TaxID=6596 RepID=UPI00234EE619|nr:integrin alpha-7-like [Mercenaria mercenaria]
MSQAETPVTSLSDIKNSDCTKQTCSQLICTLSNMHPTTMAYIQMEFEIDSEIQTVFKEESVELISIASVEMGQGNIQSRQVSTTLKRKVISFFKKEVPWWIGVLSVLGGIVLLSLISLVLWKVGFFERKLRDELVKRKAQIPYSGQVTGKMPTLYSGQVSGKRVTDESGQVSGRKQTDDAGQVSGRCLTVDGGQVTGKKDRAKNSKNLTGQKPTIDFSDCDGSIPLMQQ